MNIHKIERDEFLAYEPERNPAILEIASEEGYYADEMGNILGVLLRDRIDDDWNYVILGRDERGRFRAFETKTCIETREVAETELKTKMDEIGASRTDEFPQRD